MASDESISAAFGRGSHTGQHLSSVLHSLLPAAAISKRSIISKQKYTKFIWRLVSRTPDTAAITITRTSVSCQVGLGVYSMTQVFCVPKTPQTSVVFPSKGLPALCGRTAVRATLILISKALIFQRPSSHCLFASTFRDSSTCGFEFELKPSTFDVPPSFCKNVRRPSCPLFVSQHAFNHFAATEMMPHSQAM